MRALILGAGGQLGRALVRAAPPGAETVALDRSGCDVTDRRSLSAAISAAAPDLIINASGYTAVDQAESEPESAHLLNTLAPGWIVTVASAARARTVHVSTDFVFDGSLGRPLRPNDAPAPLNVYGRTKQGGEAAVLDADRDALIIRTAWLYSAGGRNFVTTMLRLMRERPAVRVVCDQVGTPTCALGLAATCWQLAAKGSTGLFHHTDAGVASWYDFAVAIEEEAREAGLLSDPVEVVPIATADYPTAARRPSYSVLDTFATWAALGEPAPHWRVNLRRTIRMIAATDG